MALFPFFFLVFFISFKFLSSSDKTQKKVKKLKEIKKCIWSKKYFIFVLLWFSWVFLWIFVLDFKQALANLRALAIESTRVITRKPFLVLWTGIGHQLMTLPLPVVIAVRFLVYSYNMWSWGYQVEGIWRTFLIRFLKKYWKSKMINFYDQSWIIKNVLAKVAIW